MPRALITTLYALPRQQICQWIDSTCRYPVWLAAQNEIAEWAGVDSEEVEWTELDEGEFLTVDGEPVGFMERQFVELPTAGRA